MTPRVISIHALRVEGDLNTILVSPYVKVDFYPRPPGGGRLLVQSAFSIAIKFLSTPSGWRATRLRWACRYVRGDFYPRPPGGGRLQRIACVFARIYFYPRPPGGGRLTCSTSSISGFLTFLSTPSGWRATAGWLHGLYQAQISIHALRVEGD